MRIALVTPQTGRGSTVIGRVLPLLAQWAGRHELHLCLLTGGSAAPAVPAGVVLHAIGREPFIRTPAGKRRYTGVRLLWVMGMTAILTAWRLWRIAPDRVIVVKPLPATVLGVWLWSRFAAARRRIVLDVDDFELTANHLSSFAQRAAIHWAERVGSHLSSVIVGASPFLVDHFTQLTRRARRVELVPTGVSVPTDVLAQVQYPMRTPPQPVVLYVGSISISSGHRVDLLPEIIREVRRVVPAVRLRIAGDGDDVERLRALLTAAGVGDAVEWYGRFIWDDIPALLRDVAVIIDPVDASIAQRAKSSYRGALAAALGWPLVTSNVGIRPYLVPPPLHERSFASPADAGRYAQAVIGWLRHPLTSSERDLLQAHAQQYTWATLATQYEALLTHGT